MRGGQDGREAEGQESCYKAIEWFREERRKDWPVQRQWGYSDMSKSGGDHGDCGTLKSGNTGMMMMSVCGREASKEFG